MALGQLLQDIRACRQCEAHLPLEPRPVLRASLTARLRIVGQAPSTRVHNTGIPWNDASGQRLREWLMMEREQFYDEAQVCITPMAFCYPGKGKSGDLPPRPECQQWHPLLQAAMPQVELTLLIGAYAQKYYLGQRAQRTLTDTVKAWREYLPNYLPLPHPSPRNQLWLKRNAWFAEQVLPVLRARIKALLKTPSS